jgi:hypothetical protein
MAIHFACPSCQSTLQLPDGCGGQSAKCPICLADFVIPGSPESTSSAPVCAVLAPAVERVTETDVQRAQLAAKQLAAEDLAQHIALVKIGRRLRRQMARLSTLQSFQAGREVLDHTVGRVGGFFLAITCGGAGLVVLASLFSASGFGYFVATSIGIIGAGLAYLPYSFLPTDETLAPIVARLANNVNGAKLVHEQLAAEGARLREKLLAAEAEYNRLNAIFESRRQAGRNQSRISGASRSEND